MRKLRINNRIGRSSVTPLMCTLLAAGLWWLPSGTYDLGNLVSLLLVLFTGYIVAETNNTYQVLRVRSRMVASTWLFGVACLGALHEFQPIVVAVFCLAVSYYLLFRTYQQINPVADAFHTFLLLSLGSIFYPPVILFVPVYWWYMIVFMRCMSLRVFCATLVGTILPFWFWFGWQLWQENLSPFVAWWEQITIWDHLNVAMYANPSTAILHLPYFLLLFLTIWTSVYYLIYRYDDKIQTRMMIYIYMFQTLLVAAFSLFVPEPLQMLPLMLLNVVPLLAHYFTLHNSWWCLGLFFLTILAFMVVAFQTLLPELFYKLC